MSRGWKIFMLTSMLVSMLVSANAQDTMRVTGLILDRDGAPMPRTIIYHSGGTTGVINRNDFELHLKRSPDTIRITASGYITVKRVVRSGEHIQIRMTPSVTEIQEVVVQTGYQQLKPNEINGAVAVIGQEALQSRMSTNILNRIVGHSTGVLEAIGKSRSNTGITIRGLGTIEGPVDPLIVLDGFIYEGDINNINPDDVENVTILKDAASSSIWGARAGNGVIVITSRKGRFGQPLQVDLHAGQTLLPIPDLGGTSWIGGEATVEFERYLFEKGHFDNQIQRVPYASLTPAVEILLAQREGKLDRATAETMLTELASGDKRQAYRDEFYKMGMTQQYGLSMQGGDQRTSYLLSMQHNREQSYLSSMQDRLNLRSSNQFRVSDRLLLRMEGQYVRSMRKDKFPGYDLLSVAGRKPDYMTFRDIDGNPLAWDQQFKGSYTDTAGMGKLMDWKYYPATDFEHNRNRSNREELQGIASLQYRPLSFLSVTASYQYQRQWLQSETIADAESFRARDLTNRYTQVHPVTGAVKYIVPIGGIQESSHAGVNSYTWRLQGDVHKLLGAHAINAIMGAEAREAATERHTNATRYGYTEDPLNFTQVDVINPYPELMTGQHTRIGASTTLIRTRYRFVSIYGNASYIFRGKYTVSGSFRKDGSNIFGANTNDRWKPLWSAGFGWNISEENFYEIDWLNSLRLTATYGHSGNVDMTKTALPIASYGTNSITRLPFTRVFTVNNPELRWEQLSQLSVRLDMMGKDQRIRGSVSYFYKRGTDLYGVAPYDYTGWGVTRTVMRNVADMKGYGMELEIHSKNLSRGPLGWDTDFYLSWNDDRTVNYHKTTTASDISLMRNEGNTVSPVVGFPLYGIAAYRWGGLDQQGDPLGYVDGELSKDYREISNWASSNGDNMIFIGSTSPRLYGSLVNRIQWKHLSLSFNINYRLGYFFRKTSLHSSLMISAGRTNRDYLIRWQKSGDEHITHVPALVYPVNTNRDAFYSNSEINVLKADHVRLDYVNLHYSIPTAQWRRPLRKLQVHAGVQPLGILWRANSEGLDPDFPQSGKRTANWTFGFKMSL